uniref:Uncharacterized protein n=1 Tax=Siphoviridae sp. ctiOl67 TaxID=2825622 RepID=A0A8S5QJ27_9CAUD|nr:MAG TPA: hypothetical protein [Siphoviridae sp. ctiOl67]
MINLPSTVTLSICIGKIYVVTLFKSANNFTGMLIIYSSFEGKTVNVTSPLDKY